MVKKIFILGNGTDWNEKCLQKMISNQNIYFINKRVPVDGNIKNKLARIYFSYKINNKIDMPFKILWYRNIKKFIKKNTNSEDKIVVLIYDHNVFGGEISFLNYLRKNFKDIKLSYIFTNIVKYTSAMEKNYVKNLNIWYDAVFAFDPKDAQKYNFAYSPLIYDADPNYQKEKVENKDNLVFYVGQAKDRLESILECFKKLKKLGIKTDFHIVNVKKEEMKYVNEIVYNKFITYQDAINSIQNATCLIDIIQKDSTGLTIKTCEAICYDKKLITTNKHIADYPFYDPKYIRIIESADNIDEEFFYQNKDVHFSKESKRYFSAECFLERLEKELKK